MTALPTTLIKTENSKIFVRFVLKRLQDARGLKDQAQGIPKYPPEKPSLRAKSRPTSDKANYALGHSSRHGRIQTM